MQWQHKPWLRLPRETMMCHQKTKSTPAFNNALMSYSPELALRKEGGKMTSSVSQSSQTAVEDANGHWECCTLMMGSRTRENLVPEVTTWPRAPGPQLLGLQNSF